MLTFLDKIPYGTPRLRRVAFWLFTAFVCYTLFGFFAVPPILKDVLLDQLQTGLKRPTRIEKVYFNPYALHLEITGLEVSKLKGEGNLLSAGKVIAAPGISTVWHLAPVISYLQLKDLTVDVAFYDNGQYSISDLLNGGDKPVEDEATTPEQKGAIFPFALYDFEMTNATILFDDQPHHKKHVISDIFLRVPFTSSLEDQTKEFTQPKFTAVVNGDPVELKGRTLPFDQTLLTKFELGAVDIGLDQYWRYVPVETPLTLKSGRFTSNISLFFERADAHSLKLFLGGGGRLTNVELDDPAEGPVIRLKELAFDIERFSLRDNFVALKRVALQNPYVRIIRNPDGSINWADYFTVGEKTSDSETDGPPFRVDSHLIEIQNGSVEWIDRAVKGGFTRTFGNLRFTGKEIASRNGAPGSFEGSIGSDEHITITGKATLEPLAATATVTAKKVSLPAFAPYLNEAQPLLIDSGELGLSADIKFALTENGVDMKVSNGTASLTDLAANKPGAKTPSITMAALNVSGATLDLAGKIVSVDEITATGPSATVIRQRNGKIDLQTLFAHESGKTKTTRSAAPKIATKTDDWNALAKHVLVKDGTVTFKDRAPKNRTTLGVRRFNLELKDVSTQKGAVIPYSMSGDWSGRGTFSAQGKASIAPLRTDGRFRLKDFGLRPFDGYLAEQTELLVADGAAHANLTYAYQDGKTPAIKVNGDAALTGLRVKTTFADSELAGIDRLDIKSIAFKNGPNELSIGEIVLDGPRALVEFAEDGRLNIRRALRLPEPPPVPQDGAEQEKADAPALAPQNSTPEDGGETKKDIPLFAKLDIGKMSMANGAIRYADASVKPHFSNAITDMTLALTDIGQTKEARPKIDFSAKLGPTPMSVTGVLNPVITPIYSDLTISINGMELVPLTPYTIKNLAYPVEKGRLYANVTFKTENWKLDAQNKFFIEQLVLGAKDKRPDAPNVPVKFGLALLQDGNGDLELNLPIAGRLDDPNFRIGGIVFRAIVGLLFKALASPFSLIGSIFGGGGENMDFVVFEPGRAQLDQAGEAKLATIIKALTERDKLKLEVDGVIDPKTDVNGLTQVIFERKIKQQKYDSLSRSQRAATTVDAMVVAPEEYQEFLFEAYADEPDEEGVRPTTLFMVDEQPVEVMEKFIRDRIVVTDELLHELVMKRAGTIKNYIIEHNPALAERVFLLDRQDKQGKVGVPPHRADLGIN